MPLKVGSESVTGLRLGSATVTTAHGPTLVPVGATVPGAPSIETAVWSGADTYLQVGAPASNGGSAITSYQFTFNNVAVVPTSSAGLEFYFAANYTGQAARVRAVNAIGAGAYSTPQTVEEL